MTSKDAQSAGILRTLESGGRLTAIDALGRFGCFRLSARIYDLRKQGHEIEADTVEINGKHVAQYYLPGRKAGENE